jgi:hypothetical protein
LRTFAAYILALVRQNYNVFSDFASFFVIFLYFPLFCRRRERVAAHFASRRRQPCYCTRARA